MNVTVRDYARLGRLYLNNGVWEGEQIVPKQWVIDSTTPDAPHLQPGENPASSNRSGYGYQWWVPEHPEDDFVARGIYGQYIYVSQKYGVVIMKTSADPDWRSSNPENYAMIAMMQRIAAGIK
jgi:CubicO group peptidase (beta-lactamase class C family)